MKHMLYLLVAALAVVSLVAGGGAAQAGALPYRAGVWLGRDAPEAPLGTAFTYQGMLKVNSQPYSGNCDFQFLLWDAGSGGSQVGSTLNPTLSVNDGLFIAKLDFGASAFNGQARWLEAQARCPSGSGSYTSLGRQELTAAPYALYATNAGAVPWSGISSRPAGLDDGDNDTLGGLSCANNQVPLWNGSAWVCTSKVLAAKTCAANEGLKWNGSDWVCTPDMLSRLTPTCSNGQVAKFSGGSWSCQNDTDTDTLAGLSCSANQVPRWNGSAWVCSTDRIDWKNTIIVAKSGGHYTSISSAVGSIINASASNPYLVYVAPGVYTETITLIPYVHLLGAGQDATIIRSNQNVIMGGGTVTMASHTSLRELTVENYGGGGGVEYTAIYAASGAMDVLLMNVTARVVGASIFTDAKYGIYIHQANTDVDLLHVTAEAKGSMGINAGMFLTKDAHARVIGGEYAAANGNMAIGIDASDRSKIEIQNTRVSGGNGAAYNYGLKLSDGVFARLFGGEYLATLGEYSIAVQNDNSELIADSIDAQAWDAMLFNRGLVSHWAAGAVASTILRDSTLNARGGNVAEGLYRYDGFLTSEGNIIQARNGAMNTYGVNNRGTRTTNARFKGDRVEAQASAGVNIYAILNDDYIIAQEVMALAKGDTSAGAMPFSAGLYSTGGKLDVSGGEYNAEDGAQAVGIFVTQSQLKLWEVVASGVGGVNDATGLACHDSTCEIWGGSYRGFRCSVGAARGIQVANAQVIARDFNAYGGGAAGPNLGLELITPQPMPVMIHQAVLEGATSGVFARAGPGMLAVDIYNSNLIGGPVIPGIPAIQCTLTARVGNPVVTTNTGPCP